VKRFRCSLCQITLASCFSKILRCCRADFVLCRPNLRLCYDAMSNYKQQAKVIRQRLHEWTTHSWAAWRTDRQTDGQTANVDSNILYRMHEMQTNKYELTSFCVLGLLHHMTTIDVDCSSSTTPSVPPPTSRLLFCFPLVASGNFQPTFQTVRPSAIQSGLRGRCTRDRSTNLRCYGWLGRSGREAFGTRIFRLMTAGQHITEISSLILTS